MESSCSPLRLIDYKPKRVERERKGKERKTNDDDQKGGKCGKPRKGKGNKNKQRQDREEDSWKTQNPDNLKTKKVKGKVYNWYSVKNGAPEGCGCNKFVLYKPEKCQGKAWKSNLDAKKDTQKGKALKVQEALTRASNDLGDELYDSK